MIYNETTVLTPYKGIHTYKKKDGSEGSKPLFCDNNGKEYQMHVKEEIKDIPIDSKVIATQLHSTRWNKEKDSPDNRIFYKNIVLANIKK